MLGRFSLSVFVCLLLFLGCQPQTSDLAHYQQGGMFQTSPPVFSADGKEVAYCTTVTGKGSIVVVRLADRSERTLLKEGLSISSPKFLGASGDDLICRTEEPFNSTRLVRWNSTDKDFQTLSPKGVIDELTQVKPGGEEVLLTRRSSREIGMGHGILAVEYLAKTDDLSTVSEIGSIAAFSRARLLFMPQDKYGEIWKEVNGKRDRIIDQGVLHRVGGKGSVVFYGKPQKAYAIDSPMFVLDLETNKTRSAGFGHSPVLLPDGRTLLLEGYQQDVAIYSENGALIKQWKTASGVRELYEDPLTGAILLYTRESNGTKGTLFKFDAEAVVFRHVLDIP